MNYWCFLKICAFCEKANNKGTGRVAPNTPILFIYLVIYAPLVDKFLANITPEKKR